MQQSNHGNKIQFGLRPTYLALILVMLQFSLATAVFCQNQKSERDPYILRDDDKLDIIVHIWGEVKNPGEYVVQDGTNALELISIAGGPTDFSNLSQVMITRTYDTKRKIGNSHQYLSLGNQSATPSLYPPNHVINLNLKKYLDGGEGQASINALQPGDVVRIKRNSWHKWTTALKIVTQGAIVLQAVYWYSRIK